MILYVSWGGTGRAASVREAMRRAVADGVGLRYLAILDTEHFADLDDRTIEVMSDELRWLLEAQLDLTSTQLGVDDLPVEVVVKVGDVVETVVDVLGERGPAEVLIGAPVPTAEHESVEALTEALRGRISGSVSLVSPAG